MVTRTQKEIDEQIDKCIDATERGTKYPAMSYEEGVDAALRWVAGECDDAPMED